VTTPSLLVAAGAAVVLALGVLHLVLTFHGPTLRPRDRALEASMRVVHPVVTRQTTMWKLWIGFNASHSASAILFGSLYGYLALAQPALLFRSAFLGVLGGLFLVGYLVLARTCFFSTPFRCLVVASMLYGAGFAAALV
jgi:hypothetical protein